MARTLSATPYLETLLRPLVSIAVDSTLANLANQAGASLCHGFSGNAEILLELAEDLAKDDLLCQVRECAESGLQKHGHAGDWPSGLPGGARVPGLMLGLSGVGHHYPNLASTRPASPIIV